MVCGRRTLMKIADVLAPPVTSARAFAPSLAQRRLEGRWLLVGRAVWFVVALLVGVYIFLTVPFELARLEEVCGGPGCRAPRLVSADVLELRSLGLSVAVYGWTVVAIKLLFALLSALVGSLIFWRRAENAMALLTALTLVVFAAGALPPPSSSALAAQWPGLIWVFPLVAFLASAPGILILYVFPDGRFVPAWTRWVAALLVLLVGGFYLFPTSPLALWLRSSGIALTVSCLALAVYAQVYRYRAVSSPTERTQTKWVVYGSVVAAIGYLGMQVLFPLLGAVSVPLLVAAYALNYGSLVLLPLTIGIAVLRSHLWDIDVIINRTLVYGVLTLWVVGLYIVLVGSMGWVLQSRANLVVSLLATGAVAVFFQSLRERVQRGVNRLLYGQRDEPYAVLSQLGKRLEVALEPESALLTIVDTVAQAFKLPYTAIRLQERAQQVTAASWGAPAGEPLELPLVYQGEPLGVLVVSPRGQRDAWSQADLRLLTDLAHQAGVAAHAVRLTAELRRMTGDLQRSRERLVLAREEERRRLRRDLHDGVGSALAGLNFRAGAMRGLVAGHPELAEVEALLAEQRNDIRAAIADIRRLVYDLRPPALDELGLLAALRTRAAQTGTEAVARPEESEALQVTVEAPDQLSPLPAAVEVAAYRIVQEALTNVARHAHARTCVIHLRVDEVFELEIVDDGCGIQPGGATGVGLLSMRERAEELGGVCVIEPARPNGTRVLARLPLGEE
jgi:signal transduction histidine kinase